MPIVCLLVVVVVVETMLFGIAQFDLAQSKSGRQAARAAHRGHIEEDTRTKRRAMLRRGQVGVARFGLSRGAQRALDRNRQESRKLGTKINNYKSERLEERHF